MKVRETITIITFALLATTIPTIACAQEGSSGGSSLRSFLDYYGLNLLGDTLAGVFAVLAFLAIVATLILQRQTVADIKEQNRLSRDSAAANYKLAIHDKRLAVYLRLKECAVALSISGSIERESYDKIFASAEDAKFVFGEDVTVYVTDLRDKAWELVRLGFRRRRLDGKQNDGLLSEAEAAQLEQTIAEQHVVEDWFYENLTDALLDQTFGPSLKLPSEIS
ncbi:hypothetical protein [Shinella sp. DD12]|uniref:hypothetical protein n=1 Tax=Shinella sp. DD12 TaxID=1410620 RepID=UPI000437CA6B|nr:hypothetical protein [Shinella sp. DD12]EYR79999.1 hypothetical protein SHLA_1c001790 [Shinella sp. DD12]